MCLPDVAAATVHGRRFGRDPESAVRRHLHMLPQGAGPPLT
jgi:hypothetical protein